MAVPATHRPSAEQLKRETRPEFVIADAVRRFGIEAQGYTVSSGADGSPRIVHAGRQYNLGDFYTKHLKTDWATAERALEQSWQAGQGDSLPKPASGLWEAFSSHLARLKSTAAEQRIAIRTRWKAERAEIRETFKKSTRGRSDLHRVRAEARALRVIAEAHARARAARALAALRPPSRADAYRAYLTACAQQGDLRALEELRRLAPPAPEATRTVVGRNGDRAAFALPGYVVEKSGSVTYNVGRHIAVVDAPRHVRVVLASDAAYEAGLRVAVARFGSNVTLNGDERFIAGIVAAARRNKIALTVHRANTPGAPPLVLNRRLGRLEKTTIGVRNATR